jgi:hypothetical protein
VVAAYGEPPDDPAASRAWVNRLLDETGSDRRALVQLLLRLRATGCLPRSPLRRSPRLRGGPFRARLSFEYAAATFLDVEMARWAVDAWGYALGVVAADCVWSPPPAAVAPEVTAPRPVVTPPAPALHTYHAAPTLPPALVAARGGKIPGRVRRAVARANAPPVHNPFPANFDRLAGGAFMLLLALSAVGMWMGIATRREAGGLEVPERCPCARPG